MEMRHDANAQGRPKDPLPGDTFTSTALTPQPLAGPPVDPNGAHGSTVEYAAGSGTRGGEDNFRLVRMRLGFSPLREAGVAAHEEPGATAGHHVAAPGGPVPCAATNSEDDGARAPHHDGLEGPHSVADGSREAAGAAEEYAATSPQPADNNVAGDRCAASPPPQLPAAPLEEELEVTAVVLRAGSGAAAGVDAGQPPPRPLQQQARQEQSPAPGGRQRSAEGCASGDQPGSQRPAARQGRRARTATRAGWPPRPDGAVVLTRKLFEADNAMYIGKRIAKFLLDEETLQEAIATAADENGVRHPYPVTVYARHSSGAPIAKFSVGVKAYYCSRTKATWRLTEAQKLREHLHIKAGQYVYLLRVKLPGGGSILVVEPDGGAAQPGMHGQAQRKGDDGGPSGLGWAAHGSGQLEPDHPDEEGGEAELQGTKRAQPEQQEELQAAASREDGAGPSGLFAAGGAWQGAENACGERPGKRPWPASCDTDDEDFEGAQLGDEAPPVPHKPVDEAMAVSPGTKRAQPEQQEELQAAAGREGGAGPSGLFAAGGAWQGAENASGERPGRLQRPASSDTDDEVFKGAQLGDEAPPVPHKPVDEAMAVSPGTKRAQPEQQEELQAAAGREGGAGPSGLFAAGGAWQGAENASGERPGKRQRPASSDTDDEDFEGAQLGDEAPPILRKPVDEAMAVLPGSMRNNIDTAIAALREAKAKVAALAADKAALAGQLRKEKQRADAAVEQLDSDRKAAKQRLQVMRDQLAKAEADGAALAQQLKAARVRAEAVERQFNQDAAYLASALQQEGLRREREVAQQ